jgi:phosphatidylglycerol:prolipoprotein diacylglycerol transferase
MLPVLQIGPLAIQTPGLILLAGLWYGLVLSEKFSARRSISSNYLYNLVFTAFVAGLLGGRAGYVLRYSAAFVQNPLSLISLNTGLFSIPDGMLIGGLAAWIYAARKKLKLLAVLDTLTPLLGVLGIAIALAHVASGAAFGSPTSLPWGIELWGARRQPTQIYETLIAGLILAALWPGRKAIQNWPNGQYFLAFVALSALSRLFLERFRGDSQLLPGGFRAAQVIAWILLTACLFGLHHLRATSTQEETKSP